ncbi:MAG: hypothetical protein KIT31_37835 [Deltaproteobacteria bacterium]|nr:hypothetical protein [Deltaproteobacteria bacterium]
MQRLVDLGRKTLRYWWLIGLFAGVGGALSFAFTMMKGRTYQSWSTLFYQERIQSQLLNPTREEVVQRNIGDKYRELLTARAQLRQIVDDPALNPFPPGTDPDVAVEKLREQIKLESRGPAFRILYTDVDPARAKAVTEKLTKLLQDKDEALSNETAIRTLEFATSQKETAAAELQKREKALTEFLNKHPEFVSDPNQVGLDSGAAIRKAQKAPQPQGDPRIVARQRQRDRIQYLLSLPPDAPPVKVTAPPTPERQAAEAALAEAQRELEGARRALADAKSKYQDIHPTVQSAQARFNDAQKRVRQAEAAIPPEVTVIQPVASSQDREKLRAELSKIESEIADLQKSNLPKQAEIDNSSALIVKLETDHAELRRAVGEQREQVTYLANGVFRAQMEANTKAAEQGGRLRVVDEAFKPQKPAGPGRMIFLMAGTVLFLSLGMALAIGLAVIDDRLYRRADLDQLGVVVLGVIPPATARKRKKTNPKRKATAS